MYRLSQNIVNFFFRKYHPYTPHEEISRRNREERILLSIRKQKTIHVLTEQKDLVLTEPDSDGDPISKDEARSDTSRKMMCATIDEIEDLGGLLTKKARKALARDLRKQGFPAASIRK